MTDFTVQDEGSLVILWPRTEAAKDWAGEHINPDAIRWAKDGYVIEPRYVGDIVAGFESEGLTCEVTR